MRQGKGGRWAELGFGLIVSEKIGGLKNQIGWLENQIGCLKNQIQSKLRSSGIEKCTRLTRGGAAGRSRDCFWIAVSDVAPFELS